MHYRTLEQMNETKYTPSLSIGILGGMGPSASADFYTKLVRIAQYEYRAEQDTDFPTVYLYSLALRGFDETGFSDPEEVKKQLIEGVKKLTTFGCDFITIPCNTVHYFMTEMQQAVTVPILSILEVVAKEAVTAGHTKVGLLSSQSTRELRLYEEAFANVSVDTISATDEEQTLVNEVIRHVMGGAQDENDTAILKKIADRFIAEGASAVVLGCTELPLAIKQTDVSYPLLNSIEILARTALKRTYNA